MSEIIYAKASGAGASAIAIVRMTGAKTHALVAKLLKKDLPKPRFAALRTLIDPDTEDRIDQALVLTFVKGASYTGEESAEFHLHGGEAVYLALSDTLEKLGARLARPGEFSRRALQNGALDLTQAEAVGALIEAETQLERKQALRALEGEIGELASRWRETLISMIGLLETGVDFVEEALGGELIEEARLRLEILRTELSLHIEESKRVELRRDRPIIALIGPPNAGKSSLLNAIAGVERAIVSATPGTTRDAVDLSLKVSGREIVLSDTAGIRETTDEIEREGVARSQKAMENADRRIFVVSADTWTAFSPLIRQIEPKDAIFWTKSDLSAPDIAQTNALSVGQLVIVSSREPQIARRALERFLSSSIKEDELPRSPLIGSTRRIALLESGDRHLERAAEHLSNGSSELVIEELRRAADNLSAMTGVIGQEDVLDVLFSRFCIGK